MRHALELGINWIDTAAVYGLGHSEEVVGRLLRELPRSQRPFIFTKCGLVLDERDPMRPPRRVLKPDSIRRECDALRPIAKRHGTSVSAIAIAWTLAWPGVTGAIVGARTPKQVDGWIGAASIALTEQDLDEIASVIRRTKAGVGPARPGQPAASREEGRVMAPSRLSDPSVTS
jgi:aryl-alcohol dehydrogenase-like predicted oxidoreductase